MVVCYVTSASAIRPGVVAVIVTVVVTVAEAVVVLHISRRHMRIRFMGNNPVKPTGCLE